MLTPDRTGPPPAVQVVIEGLEPLFPLCDGGADIGLHLAMDTGQAVLLGREHGDPLPTALEQRRLCLGLVIFPRAGRRLDAVAEARPHHGISLGQRAERLGED